VREGQTSVVFEEHALAVRAAVRERRGEASDGRPLDRRSADVPDARDAAHAENRAVSRTVATVKSERARRDALALRRGPRHGIFVATDPAVHPAVTPAL
jgi:hypothetical protein